MKDHIKIAMAMKRYGGSFAQGLGEALLHADSENIEKIESTWPEMMEFYLEMAQQDEQKETFA